MVRINNMHLPNDIQLIIKEYSQPYYKKPLHYKAINSAFNELPVDCKTCNILFYRLKRTDYTNHKIKLANTYYPDDIYRASCITTPLFTYIL